jgi:hypothetical protein
MTTDIFGFYLQNRPNQTSQTGGQRYSDTSPLVLPGLTSAEGQKLECFKRTANNIFVSTLKM